MLTTEKLEEYKLK